MCSESAAAEKEPRSAAARKYLSCCKVKALPSDAAVNLA
jgi:hypothetical protein